MTKTQINKIQKAKGLGKGVDIKISKTQITKVVRKGGSLFSSLVSLGTKLLPKAVKMATKVIPAVTTGALTSLGNFGMDKILGQGVSQKGGFLIPQDKIQKLIENNHLLTNKQKQDILIALQSGGELIIKPTLKQRGGFLGTLLATIGVPLLLKALTGNGMQNRPRSDYGMQNRPYRDAYLPYIPPPFYTHSGMGCKKKDRQRIITREKQLNPPLMSVIEKPPFLIKAISNFDIMKWIDYMRIPNFNGVISRDQTNTYMFQQWVLHC